MAYHIPRLCLSENHVEIIPKLLLIKPIIKNNFARGNRWGQRDMVKESVLMLKTDKLLNGEDTREPDDYNVYLPYAFTRILLNIPIPNYHPMSNYNFVGNLYESQVQVASDAIDHLEKYGSVTLNLYTSFGKTVLGAYLGAWSKKITLILYTNTILEPQWLSTFKIFTDARIWIVGSKEGPPADGPHVILCMNTRFKKLDKEYIKHIGTVIYDEADTFCTPGRVDCLLDITPKYVIAATATLIRDDGMHLMMESVCGKHIIRKISRKPFVVYKYMTGIHIEQPINRQGTPDWSKVTLAQSTSAERNMLIYSAIIHNRDKKILVLTWRKEEHVLPLYHWFKNMGLDVDYMAGTKKTYKDSKVLIGTIAKIGRGFDEKAACDNYNGTRINLLILVGSTRSVKLLEQVAGRVFRDDFPQIIHFVDECSISKNHWKVASPWYKSRNGDIYEVLSPYYRENIHTIENDITHIDNKILEQQIANLDRFSN